MIGVVLEGEDNKIRIVINENEFRLQKSDVFWVPKLNEYGCVMCIDIDIRQRMNQKGQMLGLYLLI